MPLENGDDVAEIPAIPAKKSTTQQKKASETVNGKSNFFLLKLLKQIMTFTHYRPPDCQKAVGKMLGTSSSTRRFVHAMQLCSDRACDLTRLNYDAIVSNNSQM